jgi:hypothetical protein
MLQLHWMPSDSWLDPNQVLGAVGIEPGVSCVDVLGAFPMH